MNQVINNSPKREKSLWQKIWQGMKDEIRTVHQKNIKWILTIWLLLASLSAIGKFHDGFSITKLLDLFALLIALYLGTFIIFLGFANQKDWKKITKEYKKLSKIAKTNNPKKYRQIEMTGNFFNFILILGVLLLIIRFHKSEVFEGFGSYVNSWNKFWKVLLISGIFSSLLSLFFIFNALKVSYIRELAEKKEDGGNN